MHVTQRTFFSYFLCCLKLSFVRDAFIFFEKWKKKRKNFNTNNSKNFSLKFILIFFNIFFSSLSGKDVCLQLSVPMKNGLYFSQYDYNNNNPYPEDYTCSSSVTIKARILNFYEKMGIYKKSVAHKTKTMIKYKDPAYVLTLSSFYIRTFVTTLFARPEFRDEKFVQFSFCPIFGE